MSVGESVGVFCMQVSMSQRNKDGGLDQMKNLAGQLRACNLAGFLVV